ncbi:MAG: hypothetical protein AAFZ07_04020 [Actinomycetota bacterium]
MTHRYAELQQIVRDARKAYGLTSRALGDLLGVSEATVKSAAAGRVGPRSVIWDQISRQCPEFAGRVSEALREFTIPKRSQAVASFLSTEWHFYVMPWGGGMTLGQPALISFREADNRRLSAELPLILDEGYLVGEFETADNGLHGMLRDPFNDRAVGTMTLEREPGRSVMVGQYQASIGRTFGESTGFAAVASTREEAVRSVQAHSDEMMDRVGGVRRPVSARSRSKSDLIRGVLSHQSDHNPLSGEV